MAKTLGDYFILFSLFSHESSYRQSYFRLTVSAIYLIGPTVLTNPQSYVLPQVGKSVIDFLSFSASDMANHLSKTIHTHSIRISTLPFLRFLLPFHAYCRSGTYSVKRPAAMEDPTSQKLYVNHHQQLRPFPSSTLAIMTAMVTPEPMRETR